MDKMRKGSVVLILTASVLLLGVWTGISIGAPPQGDAWLGIWDTITNIPNCPGPEPDGSWTGTFEVSGGGGRYNLRWPNVDYGYAVDILGISQSNLEIWVHDPWGSEITFRLASEGKATYTQIQKYELDRDPPNPCARSSGVAIKRITTAPQEKPEEEKPEEENNNPPRGSMVIGEIIVETPQVDREDHFIRAKAKIHWTCPAMTPDTVRQWPDGKRWLNVMSLEVYWMDDHLYSTRSRLLGESSAVIRPGDPSKFGIWEYDLEINGNFLHQAEVGVYRLTLKMEGSRGFTMALPPCTPSTSLKTRPHS